MLVPCPARLLALVLRSQAACVLLTIYRKVSLPYIERSYGAKRPARLADERPAELQGVNSDGFEAMSAWLIDSADWISPLHYIQALTEARTIALLRAGADVHLRSAQGGPSPLELATRQDGRNHAVAKLIITAASPWSPKTHYLYPVAARALANEISCILQQLRRLGHKAWSSDPLHPTALLPLIIDRSVRRIRLGSSDRWIHTCHVPFTV